MMLLLVAILLCSISNPVTLKESAFAKTKKSVKVTKATKKYVIKVNKQRNVVTIYKNNGKKYKPYKAFVCSTGKATPVGTFPLGMKYRWHELMGPSFGQYCSRITGNFLFHSVWYYQVKKNTQSYVQYNRLGTTASHGCIRLTVADSKWIYDNCPSGTKVVIYNSNNPGPLGKPKAKKMSGYMGWDPTDPDPNNPYFIKLKSFQLNKKKVKLSLGKGKKYQTTTIKAYRFRPKKAMIKGIRYVSSNPKIAKVNQKGVIKAKKAGTCKIFAYTKDGTKIKRVCCVTVKKYKVVPKPTVTPTPEPTIEPTQEPTATPTVEPTATPTAEPTVTKTAEPTLAPTE